MIVSINIFPICSRYTKADFLFVRSWVPCIFFSGGVTFGNIGRQLAVVRYFIYMNEKLLNCIQNIMVYFIFQFDYEVK